MSFSKIKLTDLTFEDEIGRGGYSTIYRAKWNLPSQMSIEHRPGLQLFTPKNIAAKKTNSPDQRELEVMSKLDHANIVKLLGVVDEKPDFFLILELCDGGSLRKYLTKQYGKRLPFDQFCDWAEQAASPLEYLRKQRIIHKDVKSDNYVIASNNILKLTDFGLAKRIEATIQNATQRGTPGYMAPELLKGFILSPSFDIFSYGIVLWELFTTEVPFEGDDPNHVTYKMCAENARPTIPPDCPKELAELMRQCWQEDWKRRPSIEDVLAVITRVRPISFLIAGLTGVGKSALGNSILSCASGLDAEPFCFCENFQSPCTQKSKAVTAKVLDQDIIIVDTPGFCYYGRSTDEVLKVAHELKRGISMISPGPHVILFALTCGSRMTHEVNERIEMVKYQWMSFNRDFAEFCIVVFTHTDCLSHRRFLENQTIDDFVRASTPRHRQLLEECNMRYVGFNNVLRLTLGENKEKVQRLLTMANDLVKQNDGKCFTLKD